MPDTQSSSPSRAYCPVSEVAIESSKTIHQYPTYSETTSVSSYWDGSAFSTKVAYITPGQSGVANKVSFYSTANQEQFQFVMKITIKGGKTQTMGTVNLFLDCSSSQTSIVTVLASTIYNIPQYDSASNKYTFDAFPCTKPTCCLKPLVYKISSSNTAIVVPVTGLDSSIGTGGFGVGDGLNGQKYLQVTSVNTLGTYTAYVQASNEWNTVAWTSQITIKVVCSPTSVSSFIVNTTPTGYLDKQHVNVNDNINTHFASKTMSSDNINCPFTATKVVDTADINAAASTKLSISGTSVIPTNIALNKVYSFYLIYSAQGGFKWLNP